MQENPIPYGYCRCGCGQKTRISPSTKREKGWIRGEPRRFVNGHNGRKYGFDYEVDEATGCWNWTGSLKKDGYGQTSLSGKTTPAHQWSYKRAKGPVPEGLELDHLCRNRCCINPDHLEAVTPTENRRRGLGTKLTVEQARAIKYARRYRGSIKDLAEKYGVGTDAIAAIRAGTNWGDI